MPLEEFKRRHEPSQPLRVALLSTLYPGFQGDLVLKSAQAAVQHLQSSVGQGKLASLVLSLIGAENLVPMTESIICPEYVSQILNLLRLTFRELQATCNRSATLSVCHLLVA